MLKKIMKFTVTLSRVTVGFTLIAAGFCLFVFCTILAVPLIFATLLMTAMHFGMDNPPGTLSELYFRRESGLVFLLGMPVAYAIAAIGGALLEP